MLTQYLREAMRAATDELLPGGEGFYGSIPAFDGVWSNAQTLELCRDQLQEAFEDWLLFRLTRGLPIPAIGGVDLSVTEAA